MNHLSFAVPAGYKAELCGPALESASGFASRSQCDQMCSSASSPAGWSSDHAFLEGRWMCLKRLKEGLRDSALSKAGLSASTGPGCYHGLITSSELTSFFLTHKSIPNQNFDCCIPHPLPLPSRVRHWDHSDRCQALLSVLLFPTCIVEYHRQDHL